MTFLSVTSAMVVVAATFLVWPLLRRHGRRPDSPAAELAAHQRALAKLGGDLAKGRLALPEYLKARAAFELGLEARLEKLVAMAPAVADDAFRWKTGLAAAFALAALVGGLYLAVGNWQAALGGAGPASQPSEQQMVATLARRLATTDGKDADGWVMLGRSYVVLGRYREALQAYDRAHALLGDSNSDVLADYAEAMILADPSALTGAAAALLDKTLQAAPDNPKALWYGGMLALAEHNQTLAVLRWQKILAQNPAPGIRNLVTQHLQELGAVSTTVQTAAPASALSIPVRVALAASLQARVTRGATLFVFVRAAGSASGPPVWARRLSAADWPVQVTLTSADTMMPGASLNAARQVKITARLSLDGDALSHRGDLQGSTLFEPARRGTAYVTIDRVLP